MESCEALWTSLEPVSMYDGENRIVVERDDGIFVQVPVAEEFNESLTSIFFSPAGLYFSRKLRHEMFDLLEYINDEMLQETVSDDAEIKISRSKFKAFRHKVHKLITAIRLEAGAYDLEIGKEGPLG